MEQQMHNIFDEEVQVKRVMKEINTLSANDELKSMVEWHITYIRKQILMFHVSLQSKFIKKFQMPFSEPINMKIIYPRDYPYSPPRLYFTSANINDVYTLVGRDYFGICCPGWSPKSMISDIILAVPHFFFKTLQNCQRLYDLGVYHRGTFVQLQSLYLQKSCEFYPIQILYPKDKTPAPTNGMSSSNIQSSFMIVNMFDIIFLDHCALQNYGRLSEVFPLGAITKIYRNKRQPKKLLIFLRSNGTAEEVGIEIIADDTNSIIESILTKKQNAPVFIVVPENQQFQETLNNNNNPLMNSPQAENNGNGANTIEQINEEIMIYESMLEKNYNEANVNNLIILYKKAIEYCSARNSDNYKIYLNKMQELLSNETVQVIISSTVPEKSPEPDIFDFFNDPKSPTQQNNGGKATTNTQQIAQALANPSAKPNPTNNSIDLLDL